MERNISQFTVLFQPPFWVGIAERWSQDGYQAARVVFGAEPTDAQLYQWLQREWPRLPFGPVLPETAPRPALANPKRMQREAAGEKKEEKKQDEALTLIYQNLEDRMKSVMGTKVSIHNKDKNKGRIEIEYYSEAELERIVEMIESIG